MNSRETPRKKEEAGTARGGFLLELTLDTMTKGYQVPIKFVAPITQSTGSHSSKLEHWSGHTANISILLGNQGK